MILLRWSHECIVGVGAMDDQHGVLMDTLNELRVMLIRSADRRDVCLQLERLIYFTRMHFQSEELLLLQHRFPGAAEHHAAHRRLIQRLQTALDEIARNEAANLSSMLEFLPSWYLEHVERVDRPYGAWLNQRGVY